MSNFLKGCNNLEQAEKLRFERTKGTEKQFEQFIKLWKTLGIKITPIKELIVNMDFDDFKDLRSLRK